MEIKAIITTWSTKSKTPSGSQFVTDKKHCVAGRLMLFWYLKKILTKKHSFLPFLLRYIWRKTTENIHFFVSFLFVMNFA